MNAGLEVEHGNFAVTSVDGAPAATLLGGAAKDDAAGDTASHSCLPPRKRGMRGGKKEADIGELTKALDNGTAISLVECPSSSADQAVLLATLAQGGDGRSTEAESRGWEDDAET